MPERASRSSTVAPGIGSHHRLLVFAVSLCVLMALAIVDSSSSASHMSRAAVFRMASRPGVRPVVTSVSPSVASAGGGASVTITGSGFGATSSVFFGSDVSSTFRVISPTLITATAPTDSGSVAVRVVTPSGTSVATRESVLTYAATGQLPVTASGRYLEVGGIPTRFTGVNAYELATAWGTNAGCGGMETPAL